MRNIKITLTIVFLLFIWSLSAQNKVIKGRITDPEKFPVKGAVITVSGAEQSIQTGESGEFKIETSNLNGIITISAEGFYEMSQPLQGREEVKMVLIPESKLKYNEKQILPFPQVTPGVNLTSSRNISHKDMGKGSTVESAIQGEVAGLRVVNKSGMPGEGAYLNMRGLRSFISNNTPLIVVNGIPYLKDMEDSPIIGGYSKGIFNTFNINDIQNITVLRGADASIYGSMGANGVILIETNGADSDDLDTKITFSSQFGVNWNSQSLPVMEGDDYKSYLSDIGMTHYDDMDDLFDNFPFLKDDPDYYYNYLYNNTTDWQEEIYSPSLVMDNILRVEGGDAVAKYDISLGYMRNGGVLNNTQQDHYHTQINANIMINRKLELFTTIGLAYLQSNFQEQGLLSATNPVLVAYNKSPLLSPYKKDTDGNILDDYDSYRFGVSNPVAIINTLTAENKQYNVNLRLGLNYQLNKNLRLSGVVGLFYDYNQENIFIPGITDQTIIPMNNDLAENTVRTGVGETKNMFYSLTAYYQKIIADIHAFNLSVGTQLLRTENEYDAGSGYNTASDFYQTLDYVESGSESFYGYINEWNWMNLYLHGDYTWKSLLRTSLNMAVDGSSSTGLDADRFGIFPSVGLTFMSKNLKGFINSSTLNRLDFRAEYGIVGNSRFSSNYGKNYYHSAPYLSLSGIVRSNIPNTKLKFETTKQLNLGIDLSVFRHRLDISFDYYNAKSTDVLFAQSTSAVYGSSNYYSNSGELDNKGIELAFSAAILQNKKFEWIIGGNIAAAETKVVSLGNVDESVMTLSDDAQIITRVDENPYNFYGYVSEGVFATATEADASGLLNWRGDTYSGGDIHYKDVNGDKLIDDQDKQILGSAAPDFFGGFYTSLRYRNFTLLAEFTYSIGNEAYNAVRRSVEAMDNFDNQSLTVVNRWRFEGQETSVPRAVYGDPMENNAFSSRWIEDASFVKLKNVTLNYHFDKTILGFFRSGTIYVTGENLYTWTDYLGLDPEFSYSYSDAVQGVDYAKVVLPHSVKFGFNLKF